MTDFTSTSSSTTSLGFLQPFIENVLNKARAAGNQVTTQPFGPTLAAPNAAQTQAANQTISLGQGLSGQGAPTRALATSQIRGDFLDPASNPFLRSAIDAVNRPVGQAFTEQALPGIANAADEVGAFGGSREGIAKALATRNFIETITDNTSKIILQNFLTERQIQQNSPALLGAATSLDLQGPQLISAGGEQLQGVDQAMINRLLSAFRETTEAPFRAVSPEASIIFGSPVPASSFSTTTTPGPSTLSNVIGGALGGASLGASFADVFQSGSTTDLTSLLIGGILGGGASFFG